MKRRTRVFLIGGLVIALLAAAWGALVATGFDPTGEDSAGQPSGAASVLRVQPLSPSVACSDQKQVVQVFLDDLAARPSPHDAGAPFGIATFQLAITYDPQVLQIAAPVDVEVNPALSSEDPDGDGTARSFFPLTDIDNYEGRALVGAGSIGPSGAGQGNFEEGPDPAAKGEPLLLLTLRFLTVGEGDSRLAMYAPVGDSARERVNRTILIDPNGQEYTPVAAKASGLTVTEGACAARLPAIPRPIPTPTPVPPTATHVIAPTPVPVGPTPAAEAGRADCPEGWNVYKDPDSHFSICYPEGLRVVAGEPVVGRGMAVQISTPEGPGIPISNNVFILVSWRPFSYVTDLAEDICNISTPEGIVSRTKGTISLLGRDLPACFAEVQTFAAFDASERVAYRQIVTELPTPGGGVLFIRLAHFGPDFAASRTLIDAILNTISFK